ncbi:MAG: fimbrial protein [Bacteroidales bacterium]|jgi:hypothetical protein|nr:fimbrial protein [Bacteroidales bacterium]MCI2121779.1 fimbrial protein [Bacteroidales bacterium]MCI2144765.1 fimbrial protein [Bacteroidales bacterium]
MKLKLKLAGLAPAIVALAFASCSRETSLNPNLKIREAVVNVTVHGNSGTKTVLSSPPAEDARVNDLTILIYRNNSQSELSENILDGSYAVVSPSSISDIKVRATAGNRNIYVVANAHGTALSTATDEASFKAMISELKQESEGDFTMVGSEHGFTLVEGDAAVNDVTIAISRMAARITLSGIDADFSNTTLAGKVLTDVKVYVTNVNSSKFYHDGTTSPSDVHIINYQGYVAEDSPVSGNMVNMFYESVAESVGTGSNSDTGVHYFYAYQNMISEETEIKFTRLVIEGKIDGETYYWPININQTGFRSESPGHDGVKANCSYDYKVKITRIGSNNPDDAVETAIANVTLTVTDWTVVPCIEFEF